MGCWSSFNDKYQECEFLIEELKLIITQSFSGKFTENELKGLNEFKNEKEDKIRVFIEELEKTSTDEIQKRKVTKLKEIFYDVLDDDENSEPIPNNNNSNDSSKNENNQVIQIYLS